MALRSIYEILILLFFFHVLSCSLTNQLSKYAVKGPNNPTPTVININNCISLHLEYHHPTLFFPPNLGHRTLFLEEDSPFRKPKKESVISIPPLNCEAVLN